MAKQTFGLVFLRYARQVFADWAGSMRDSPAAVLRVAAGTLATSWLRAITMEPMHAVDQCNL